MGIRNAAATMPRDRERERDAESGRYTTEYTPEDVIEAIENHDNSATTAEVQDYLGCSRKLALDRLHELEDSGQVKSRGVSNTYLWSVVDE